jgi:hypothetical protein
MTDTQTAPIEAPIIRLRSHDELMRALARLRQIKDAESGPVAALEASALEIAIARYLKDSTDGLRDTDPRQADTSP